MKTIELLHPKRNPILFPLAGIQAIVLQPKRPEQAQMNDLLVITVQGLKEPYTYEGPGARRAYEKIRELMEATTVNLD